MKLLKKKEAIVSEVSKAEETKKPESADVAQQRKPSKPVGKSVFSWLVQPIVAVWLACIIALVSLEALFLEETEEAQREKVRQIVATAIKNNVDSYLQQREMLVDALAKSIAATNSVQDIERIKSQFSAMYTDVEKLFVVLPDQLPKLSELYPQDFVSVDMIRKIAKGGKPPIEAFKGKDGWLFQAGTSVKSATGVPHIVIVLFNTDSIKPLLKQTKGFPEGQAGLAKADSSKAFLKVGSGDDSERLNLRTIIRQWDVIYAPKSEALGAIDRTLVWGALLIVAVLSSIAIYLFGHSHGMNIRRDLMLAAQQMKQEVSGDTRKPKPIAFADVNSMVVMINQASKAYKQKMAAQAKSQSPKANKKESSDESPLFEDDLLDLEVLADSTLNRDPLEKELTEENESMVTEMAGLDVDVPQSIFRAYDIRGVVDETLNEKIVELLGRAIASEAVAQGQSKLCVAYDGRLSSVAYCQALTRGITHAGVDAIVVGQVPTPVLYFSTHHFDTGSGVMITGSHNPANYNGFKMMLAGKTLSGDDIQKLYNRIVMQDFVEGDGIITEQSVSEAYLDYILNDIAVAAPLKVVVDAGNGVAGELGPSLIEELGCEVIPLHCEIDGTFPNHHPDPGKPENLQDLIAAVKEHDADIGLAFDGDGDRVGVVTNEGKIIWPDRLLMLFAKDVVSRNPGADVIYDVKCSRRLNGLISSYGGRPIMWKTGHSLIKAKMKESGALLAGEMSGHIFFKERWFGFDDGLYSAARLLEILGIESQTSDEVFATFPEDVSTPEINITVTDESKFAIVDKLCAMADQFTGGNASTIDGLRVDYPNGWGLCRASNTTPMLVLRFEADDDASLEEIKEKFKAKLQLVDAGLNLDF